MNVLKLTKEHFKKNGIYNEYIGAEDVSNFKGHLKIEANLGWTLFKSINVSGYIYIEAGSGIEAGEGIKAGSGIKAGWGIKAGAGIKAGWRIEAGVGIEARQGIEA